MFVLFSYRPGTWSTCPSGYFLNGLYRTSGNNLHNIEEGKCCKPVNHPNLYGQCYYEDIRLRFDEAGWSVCSRNGYFVTGIYRDSYNDWLHNIDKLKCCKMWTGKCNKVFIKILSHLGQSLLSQSKIKKAPHSKKMCFKTHQGVLR